MSLSPYSVFFYLRIETHYSKNSLREETGPQIRLRYEIGRKPRKTCRETKTIPKETPEMRTRKQTAKGKEFHIELVKDHTASVQRAWRKQLNKIENALANSENASLLQS